MRWHIQRYPNGSTRLTVEFTEHDFMSANLNRIDRAMLHEKPRGLADILLDAELIARRLEEAQIMERERVMEGR